MFIDHRQEQWLEWLGTAEFVKTLDLTVEYVQLEAYI